MANPALELEESSILDFIDPILEREDFDIERQRIDFELESQFAPRGDQPKAIEALTRGIERGDKYQTLLGVTGSGKTYTMANVIENIQKPTLVISPNKTLCSQLDDEFKHFFPNNSAEFFVSAFDFYQPEAYIPHMEHFIGKKALTNQDIAIMRAFASASAVSRTDTIISATVSCIFGLGDPNKFQEQRISLKVGERFKRDELLRSFVKIHYERNDVTAEPGCFRVRGDVVDIYPLHCENVFRIEFFGDEIDRITEINAESSEIIQRHDDIEIFAADHFVTSQDILSDAVKGIEEEMKERVCFFLAKGMVTEAKRIEERTLYDIALLKETGHCPGIENYVSYFIDLKPGEPPYCLIDFLPKDHLIIMDESHITVPQLGAMCKGAISRIETLVEHGWRLPSALNNRPLTFEEFEQLANQIVFVSATPGPFERKNSSQIVEQIIRPTGLVDPIVNVHHIDGEIEHVVKKIKERKAKGQQAIITTLTKKKAEGLTAYLETQGIRTCYLHGDIEIFERNEILHDFQKGEYDAIVGINLLREGLDLPSVSLVAVLDADQKGFLRTPTALIQVIGRTARNVDGEAVLYGDTITPAMEEAINETERRRTLQIEYNQIHNITPKTVKKNRAN